VTAAEYLLSVEGVVRPAEEPKIARYGATAQGDGCHVIDLELPLAPASTSILPSPLAATLVATPHLAAHGRRYRSIDRTGA
jgi:hypothetical protein